MKIVNGLKITTLGFFLSLFVIPVTSVYAQTEEEGEEEEVVQTRPNPFDRSNRMKGADPSWDPFDKSNRMKGASPSGNPSEGIKDDGQHGVRTRSPASMAKPGQRGQMGPQGLQPGTSPSHKGVMGNPMGMQQGVQQMPGIQAPQVQDDGEHGGMVMPQQMGH